MSDGAPIGREQSVSGILGVHLLILESSFVEKIETFIKRERVNSEWAISRIADQYIEQQEVVPDLNFRDKSLDIEDIAKRLLNALNGSPAASSPSSQAVIVARDLHPSAIIDIAKTETAALITEQGGWTSHSSILAREFNLPMVTGIRNLQQFMLADDRIIVDAINGEVIVNPTDPTVAEYTALSVPLEYSGTFNSRSAGFTATVDGEGLLLRLNLDQPEAYAEAEKKGAQGIGLYRSESLIRQPGKIPSEEQQFEAYRRIAEAAGEFGVRIRSFDVDVERFGSDPHWVERNPALGLRAIRLSLADPMHFRTQIRAILRAAHGRKVDIILPMISGVDEIIRSREIIDSERTDLIAAGIDVGEPQIGAMIETPAAVLTAFEIAKAVDFLCLGTNDLVQYLLAVDRDNEAVAEWYQTLHPAVIRAIRNVIADARSADTPVIVCGEMAGSPFYAPVLLGLGAREFSMNINSIQPIRKLLSGISANDAGDLVDNIRVFDTAEQIENYLREYYSTYWLDLFPTDFLNSRFR